jgi:hypothetical protein
MIVSHPTIEKILHFYRESLGSAYVSYGNHVYRVYNFVTSQFTDPQSRETLAIAAAFHDLGIWTNNTFDYLEPSIELAKKYIQENQINDEEASTIFLIIDLHHKLSKIKTSRMAESFRVADLADLSLGMIRNGIDKELIKEVRRKFPNNGFHLFLVKLFFKNLFRHPLKPLPMFKR